jgi:hypothetical protein
MVDWQDTYPEPGSFVNSAGRSIINHPVYGDVEALNYAHADYIGLRKCVAASGDEYGRCFCCGHYIRYAAVFQDAEQKIHMVGEDCAKFVSSKLSFDEYADKRLTKEITKLDTKLGVRYILKLEVPAWFWEIPKHNRPKYCSMSKFRPKNSQFEKWYLTIWGNSESETVVNYLSLLHNRKTLVHETQS